MIGGVYRHGVTPRDTRNLNFHLMKDEGARVTVINSFAPDLLGALQDMEIMRDGTRAKSALLHIFISPSTDLSDGQLHKAAEVVRCHLGVEDHMAAMVIHDKERSGGEGGKHAHLLIARAGPERVFPSGFEKIKVETAIRVAEFELGEPVQLGVHFKSSVKHLRSIGRDDVADRMIETHGPNPARPHTAVTPDRRQMLERNGIKFSQEQCAVRELYKQSDSPAAFVNALESEGYRVAPGEKAEVWTIHKDGLLIGSVDRLLKQDREEIDEKLSAVFNEREQPLDRAEELDGREFEERRTYGRANPQAVDARDPGRGVPSGTTAKDHSRGYAENPLASGRAAEAPRRGSGRGWAEGAQGGLGRDAGRHSSNKTGRTDRTFEPRARFGKSRAHAEQSRNYDARIGGQRQSDRRAFHYELTPASVGSRKQGHLRASTSVLAIGVALPKFSSRKLDLHLRIQTLTFSARERRLIGSALSLVPMQRQARDMGLLYRIGLVDERYRKILTRYNKIIARYEDLWALHETGSDRHGQIMRRREQLKGLVEDRALPAHMLERLEGLKAKLGSMDKLSGISRSRFAGSLDRLGELVTTDLFERSGVSIAEESWGPSVGTGTATLYEAAISSELVPPTPRADFSSAVSGQDLVTRHAALKAKLASIGPDPQEKAFIEQALESLVKAFEARAQRLDQVLEDERAYEVVRDNEQAIDDRFAILKAKLASIGSTKAEASRLCRGLQGFDTKTQALTSSPDSTPSSDSGSSAPRL